MSKIDDALRPVWATKFEQFLTDLGEEVLHEKDNILWIPTLDSEGNEKWIKLNIQVPTKVEEGGDGYAHEEAYRLHKVEKARKEAEAEAKKKAKIAKDKATREAKAKAEREAKGGSVNSPSTSPLHYGEVGARAAKKFSKSIDIF